MMISVIVPIYNIEKYLPRAIDSILNQTFKEIELILVNDGSTDSSGEICERYAKLDRRVKVLHKENGGAASARNKGLNICTGDFISFVDGDDWIEKEIFEELLEPMMMDQEIEVSIGTHVLEMETGVLIDAFKEHPEGCIFQPAICQQMLERTYWGWELCGKLYRKELFEHFRCNEDITHGEDLFANWHIFRALKKVYYQPRKRYHYFMRSTSATHEAFSEKVLTWLEVLRTIDDEIDPEDKILKKINRERLLISCIRVLVKMFLLDSENYYSKIIFYQELLRNKLNHDMNELKLSDTQKKQAEILKSSFTECKCRFEKDYQWIAESLRSFSTNYRHLYIYGAGAIANEVAEIMKKEKIPFDGFIVSNIKKCTTIPDKAHLVLQISDVYPEKSVGIILAMNKKNIKEVLPSLQHYGFRDCFNIADCQGILLCNTGLG